MPLKYVDACEKLLTQKGYFDYVCSKTECRRKKLGSLFGEDVVPCQTCDICISKNTSNTSGPSEVDTVTGKVLQMLSLLREKCLLCGSPTCGKQSEHYGNCPAFVSRIEGNARTAGVQIVNSCSYCLTTFSGTYRERAILRERRKKHQAQAKDNKQVCVDLAYTNSRGAPCHLCFFPHGALPRGYSDHLPTISRNRLRNILVFVLRNFEAAEFTELATGLEGLTNPNILRKNTVFH